MRNVNAMNIIYSLWQKEISNPYLCGDIQKCYNYFKYKYFLYEENLSTFNVTFVVRGNIHTCSGDDGEYEW